ncbi:MAG: hypothetical protein AAGJ51_08610 [Pseudomonadota bacterium]
MKAYLKVSAAAAVFVSSSLMANAEAPESEAVAETAGASSAMVNLDHIDMTAFDAATNAATDSADAPQNQQQAQRPNTGGHSKGGFVDRYDTNGDGEVEMVEFVAARNEGYAERDFNGDGMVHQEEYVSEYEVRLEQQLEERRERSIEAANFRFTVMDTDDDEAMSLDEFHASSKMMFTRLDTNEDGIVNDEDTAERF